MNVTFACPNCDQPDRVPLDQPIDWQCTSCEHRIHIEPPAADLPRCAVCRNPELYKKKDFPHWLGMTLLVSACAISFYTYGTYEKWLTWAILIGTAIIDGVLYLSVGDTIVCYRCNAHHRKVEAQPHHEPHELLVAERYRQERIRKEQIVKDQVAKDRGTSKAAGTASAAGSAVDAPVDTGGAEPVS